MNATQTAPTRHRPGSALIQLLAPAAIGVPLFVFSGVVMPSPAASISTHLSCADPAKPVLEVRTHRYGRGTQEVWVAEPGAPGWTFGDVKRDADGAFRVEVLPATTSAAVTVWVGGHPKHPTVVQFPRCT